MAPPATNPLWNKEKYWFLASTILLLSSPAYRLTRVWIAWGRRLVSCGCLSHFLDFSLGTTMLKPPLHLSFNVLTSGQPACPQDHLSHSSHPLGSVAGVEWPLYADCTFWFRPTAVLIYPLFSSDSWGWWREGPPALIAVFYLSGCIQLWMPGLWIWAVVSK